MKNQQNKKVPLGTNLPQLADLRYKRRKDAGKIPLHANTAVRLKDQEPNENRPGCVALKLQSVSLYGEMKVVMGRVELVAILTGYYEYREYRDEVTKWFPESMESEDELPLILYRDPKSLGRNCERPWSSRRDIQQLIAAA